MSKTKKNTFETYFEWYLDDLVAAGYIDRYDRESEVFNVIEPYQMIRYSYRMTKEPLPERFNLLGGVDYTYDYRIFWNKKAVHLFFNPTNWSDPKLYYPKTPFFAQRIPEEELWVSYIDVKAIAGNKWGNSSSAVTFPIIQKFLLAMHGVYINKKIPIPQSGQGFTIALFPNTFIPNRYFFTDGGNKKRKINFNLNTLTMYVDQRKRMIDTINSNLKKIREKVEQPKDLFS